MEYATERIRKSSNRRPFLKVVKSMTHGGNEMPERHDMDQVSEQRLWKALDSISNRLGGIENAISHIARLDERVSSHNDTLRRYGVKLEDHDTKIQDTELWKVQQPDRRPMEQTVGQLERDVTRLTDAVCSLEKQVSGLSSTLNRLSEDYVKRAGMLALSSPIMRWVFGIVAVLIVWWYTGGK